jgi:hypothetical protein
MDRFNKRKHVTMPNSAYEPTRKPLAAIIVRIR